MKFKEKQIILQGWTRSFTYLKKSLQKILAVSI